ncbi:OLC1v1028729C1 [Oldenlandia corymbosa var. corymbosa]|uniref:OLC1v1028729C1 n=1 Tax=Oldenlandia corymbosa var. corymbosa TaxID=529605 RepID=A0AAV1CCF2_OLDCO|nr:OLC1v1028729C1 [Oldenlandia corymbosa var. corymbosa]
MEIISSSLSPFDSPVISFTLMFGAIYLFGYNLIFKNWGSSKYEATSCFISLFHGSPAVILSILALIQSSQDNTNNHSSLSMLFQVGKENTASQDLVLEFSIGYFIIDLLHYIIFIPKDVLFIAHHFATLYVLVTCRYVVHHGGAALLGLLVLAEITSPCQNTWSLARYRKVDLPEAARYYEFLSPYFFTFYSVVRGVLGPLYVLKMIGAVLGASGGAAAAATSGLVFWTWISWLTVITVAIWVSILWILNLWIDLFRRRANLMKKVS